jgi:hypothetical protein
MQLLDASAEPFRRGCAPTREAFGQLIEAVAARRVNAAML